jgi:low temperature requirement protein LtrA
VDEQFKGAAVAATRRDRWARLRRSLWQPPRPHGEQPRERVVGPLELFYDLAVVVLVAQAAHHLAGHLTWPGLGEFAVVFTLVWIAWANGSLHHELHGRDDARSRSTFLVQILVLAAMGACIPAAGGARGAAFAVAAAVLFAVLAILWLQAARGDRPEYRRPSRLYVAGTAACAVLLAGTALLPAGARVPAWGLLDAAYLAVFAAVILTASPGASLTVTDALIERFGTLIIIVLGETLTGVVTGLASQPISAVTLAVGLVAVVVGFGAWWTYFDFAGQRHPRPTRPATALWMLSHLPLTAAIAAMGAAMVSLVDHAHDGRTPAATAWAVRGHRRRAGRDDAGIREPASPPARPGPVPAAHPHLRRGGRRLPRHRRRTAGAAAPRPGPRPPAHHPLGTRRRAPPGQRGQTRPGRAR